MSDSLILLAAGSSFAFFSLFYYLYQEKKQEVDKLKEIPIFRPDEVLLQTLKASSHKRLHYVAVEGVVQAEGDPLSSRFVPRCFGVIQKVTRQEHWKYWNSVTKSWASRINNRTQNNNSVPFCLVSPGSYISDIYVKVQNPSELSGQFLETVHHRIKPVEDGLANVLLEGLSGEKPVGKEETEEMLCVGTTVMGFGEAVLEGDRAVRLQPPRDGRSFLLTATDHRSFISTHQATANMWKALSALTGITGATLLAALIHNVNERRGDRSK